MPSIWCVLRNYADHAREMDAKPTDYPLFFLKPAQSIVQADAMGEAVVQLVANEDVIQHEVEMVLRIGGDGQPCEMCVGLDLSNRTLQKEAKSKGLPWLESKGFRGACVLGSWNVWHPGDYELELQLDGELKQVGNTSEMLHDVPQMLAILEATYGLAEGDLLFTGTPAGVGSLQAGQCIEAALYSDKKELLSGLTARVTDSLPLK